MTTASLSFGLETIHWILQQGRYTKGNPSTSHVFWGEAESRTSKLNKMMWTANCGISATWHFIYNPEWSFVDPQQLNKFPSPYGSTWISVLKISQHNTLTPCIWLVCLVLLTWWDNWGPLLTECVIWALYCKLVWKIPSTIDRLVSSVCGTPVHLLESYSSMFGSDSWYWYKRID